MPEEIKTCIEQMKKTLPGMDVETVECLAWYAEGYAAGAKQEAKKHGAVPDQSAGGSVA